MHVPFRLLAALVPLAFFAAACGSSSTGTGPDDAGPPGYPASHVPFPLVTNNGGPVLTSPKLVTVTFQSDPLAATLNAFSDAMPSSAWWTQTTADYGIGPMTSAAHVSITSAPATSYTDSVMGQTSTIEQLVQQNVSDGTFPDPTANTIYAIYLPPGVNVSLDGSMSCVDGGFAGYHKSAKITPKAGGAPVDASYAIIVRCTPPSGNPQVHVTQEQYMTISGSHEIVEAATDGKPITQGFAWVMGSAPWSVLGPEVADLCADVLGTGQDEWTESGFVFQRSWSNGSAMAGKDPCVPIPADEVYFNAAPKMDSVALKVGGSATIDLDAFSAQPMAAWQLKAIDVGSALAGLQTSPVALSLDKTSVQNGDTAHLTIKLNSSIPALPGNFLPNTTVVYVVSLVNFTNAHFWPILVQQQ